MGVRLEIEMKPDAGKIGLGIVRWADSMDDWREAWRDVILMFRQHEKRHFDTEGKATGDKWAELSDKGPRGGYRGWKARRFPGRPILVLRGTLRDALVKGGPGSIAIVQKRSMVVGLAPGTTLATYARAHSKGATLHGGRKLPKRPPVRYDPRITGTKTTGKESGTMTFGTAVAQLIQAHVIRHRKRAFKGLPDPFNPDNRGRMRAAGRARRSAVTGRWKTR